MTRSFQDTNEADLSVSSFPSPCVRVRACVRQAAVRVVSVLTRDPAGLLACSPASLPPHKRGCGFLVRHPLPGITLSKDETLGWADFAAVSLLSLTGTKSLEFLHGVEAPSITQEKRPASAPSSSWVSWALTWRAG